MKRIAKKRTAKKTLAALLSALLLLGAYAGPAFAEEIDFPALPVFFSVTGAVTNVEQHVDANNQAVEGWLFIRIEDENGDVTVFFVTDATAYPFESEISVGDTATGFYRSAGFAPLIFPPQYSADVLVAGMPEDRSVHVDRFSYEKEGFEGILVSEDGMLALHIGEDTQVVTADGEAFDGELGGLDLVVIYAVATRSIPAQTTPIKVIVLQ